jgi:hypothetical protein
VMMIKWKLNSLMSKISGPVRIPSQPLTAKLEDR